MPIQTWYKRARLAPSRGGVSLAAFCFGGLSLLDVSLRQTTVSVLASLLLLAWCSRNLRDEGEEHDYLWSLAIGRALVTTLIVAVGASIPFLEGRILNGNWSQVAPLLGEAVLFSLVVGSAVYLRDLLKP